MSLILYLRKFKKINSNLIEDFLFRLVGYMKELILNKCCWEIIYI